MMEVLRAHRTFGSGNNSDDSDTDELRFSSWNITNADSSQLNDVTVRDLVRQERFFNSRLNRQSQRQRPSWAPAEKPESADDNRDSTGLAAQGLSTRHQERCASTRRDERLEKWLIKNTMATCDLSCALLRPGMRFNGVQTMKMARYEDGMRQATSSILRRRSSVTLFEMEQWDVSVVIQTVDMSQGKATGLMKAIDVPWMPTAVTTYWEGEIIDFVNYSPVTGKWKASCSDDTKHWSLFEPVRDHPSTFLYKWPASLWGKRMPKIFEDCIFMRWKEKSFVDIQQSETRLSIEGFYYICMQRKTGDVEGVYFDPSIAPNQRLSLKAENGGRSLAFASTDSC
ncbi:hypothetical protein GGI25_004899 [Coemansia spiralis]|uniref:Uncharacterized protein n=2 Tax=Coemansia TaxID=4863 RepID=A0A9W8KV62_9FUNG|nr:hypothetical protein GGI25_004899 [Coemansia spiralis]